MLLCRTQSWIATPEYLLTDCALIDHSVRTNWSSCAHELVTQCLLAACTHPPIAASLQTTVRSYLQLAPLEYALYMAVSCMYAFRTSSPPAFPPLHKLATLALLYAACGVILPIALLTLNKHLQSSRYEFHTLPTVAAVAPCCNGRLPCGCYLWCCRDCLCCCCPLPLLLALLALLALLSLLLCYFIC
jgi:hypothetical protein